MHNDFYTFWRRAQYIRRQCSAFREKDINLFVHRYLLAKSPPTSARGPKSYSKRIKDLMDPLGRTNKYAMPSTSVVSPLSALAKPWFSPAYPRLCNVKSESTHRCPENSMAREKLNLWLWLVLSHPKVIASGPCSFTPMRSSPLRSSTPSPGKRYVGR